VSTTAPGSTAIGPLLTLVVVEAIRAAARAGKASLECSLDLGRSLTTVEPAADTFRWCGRHWPLPAAKERTVYHHADDRFVAVSRYTTALIKLVPTEWGAPTFEIDGIKMLPSAKVSPYEDARAKVELVAPKGRVVLDTCGGLGYFAAWCLAAGAREVRSFEKSADVIWLRSLNPWSPVAGGALTLTHGDVRDALPGLAAASVGAILHDPPRFGIAGELYSLAFYAELARVLERRGRLFHYTGTPNKLTSGRDVPAEVSKRLKAAGFDTEPKLDGVLAIRR
jgi:predicted methyltransferase